MAPFGISHTSSYSYFIVNIYLLPLLRYSASNIGVTLKSGSGVVQDHSKWGSDPYRPTGGLHPVDFLLGSSAGSISVHHTNYIDACVKHIDQYLGILLVLATCVCTACDSVIGADSPVVAEFTSSQLSNLPVFRAGRGAKLV